MAFGIERRKLNERMQQARNLLSFIKTQESTTAPPMDSEPVKILRGLFFVHLYGAFEKSFNEAIEQYLLEINTLSVRFIHFSNAFLPTALDPVFTSLRDGGRWERRISFIKSLESEDVCRISNTVFSDQLQNTWFDTLRNVAQYIGENSAFLKNTRDAHYLDEVVDKRNQVAHGRNSPADVGSLGRSPDLELRFDAVNRVLEDFFEMLEENFNSLGFIKEADRGRYRVAV